ncbi:MAG: methyltransferase domain-containing protein [Candidatus Aminicenantes bacterium]|jgi:SAM-dependent methyltransferase
MIKKLNLGCGKDYREGWVNADFTDRVKVDKIVDGNKVFPFPDNTFDYVLAQRMLNDMEDFVFTINEIHRVCKHGAIFIAHLCYYNSPTAWNEPISKRGFTENAMDFWDSTTPMGRSVGHEVDIKNHEFRILAKKKIRGRFNPFRIYSVIFKLKVIKEER